MKRPFRATLAPIAARDARQPPQKRARRTAGAATSAVTRSPRSEVPLSRADSPNANDSTPALLAPAERCRASVRDCEAVLREVLGLSRREAKAFASGGWSAMTKGEDAGDVRHVVAALTQIIRTLEAKNE